MALGDAELASSYFMQRLGAVRQAQSLPASAQFDLARSPLSDDDLENVIDEFRDSPRPREGWGLSSMFNEVLSREPKRFAVSDIAALQKNLIASGYASPDSQATGQWDPSWYASFRRFDRDNLYQQQAGRHWYSAPVESGIRAITNTLPSRVFQGIIGAAKGMAQQAPETAERVGLVGGAAGGALIGAAAGSVVPGLGTAIGAAGGAVVGGAIGFLGDLIGHDEGEDGQSIPASILDALSPYEEYKAQGPKAFMEDLGFVLTAASLIQGVGGAVGAAGAGARAIGAARLTPEAGAIVRPVIGQSAVDLAPMTVGSEVVQPASWIQAALQPAKAAGETELGVFGTITRAAARKFVPGTPAALESTLAKYSPIAFMQRLGPNVALKTFGGLSQAQMGARLFGGIGQGSNVRFREAKEAMEAQLGRNLTEDEELNLQKSTGTSTIEKAIASSPVLKTGINVPLVGDLADVAAFVLYPEKLLPLSGTRVAKGAVNLLGDTSLLPYMHAVMDGTSMSLGEARNKVKELVSPVDNAWLRADYGINREAAGIVDRAYKGNYALAVQRDALSHARADVIRQIRGELEKTTKSETLEALMAHSVEDPTDFEAWLVGLNGEKRGLDRLSDWKSANELARKTEREVGERTRYVKDAEGNVIGASADLPVPERFETFDTAAGPMKLPVRSEEVKIGGAVTKRGTTRDIDIMALEDRIKGLERRQSTYQRFAERGTSDPWQAMAARERQRLTDSEITSLKRTLEDLRGKTSKEVQADRFRIVPARKDFATKQVLAEKRDLFLRMRDEVLGATTDNARIVAQQKLGNFVDQLAADGYIAEKMAARAKVEKPDKAVAKSLGDLVKGAPSEVKLPDRIAQEFDRLGYKPVTSGDDVIFPDQLKQMTEIGGIGDYTRRAAVWETIGLSPRFRSDRSLFKLRTAHTEAELGQVLREQGIAMSAKQAMSRLHTKLAEMNHDGAVLGPLAKGKEGHLRLYKVDVRDLSAEDVFRAFEDVPGIDYEVSSKIFGALRRGAAYGGEAKLLHPVETMRAIGAATRTNGLPGFADVIRTAHADVKPEISRKAFRTESFHYKPPTSTNAALDLARSPERARAEAALKQVSANSRVSEGQRQLGMAMLDSLAVGQVKAGRFGTVDDFYRHIDVGFAEKYVADGSRALFQTKNRTELSGLFYDFEDSADWYDKSAATIADIFKDGTRTAFPLGDGDINDADLFAQILAATSPRTPVPDNMRQALEVFKQFKEGRTDWNEISGVMRSKWKMLDDIAKGRTIDQWTEATVQGVYKVGANKGLPREARARMKVWNFYNNLAGDLDKVTVDTWMASLFGYPEVTPAIYDDIEREVRAVADRVGAKPAQVQAALWTAAKHEAVAAGAPKSMLDARSFADLSGDLRQYVDKLNGSALLQRVEDEITGATTFGGDYPAVMRMFRGADFSTLAHEDAHLLRRLLPEEDLTTLEKAYGVRPATTPHGPSDDLRSIASEYAEQSGIKPGGRIGDYADVDEERAKRIADAFENQKPSPRNPATKKAYKAFVEETMAQYRLLREHGYELTPWGREGQPYQGAKDFIADVRGNKRIYYFKTLQDDAFGAGKVTEKQIAENPLLAYSGVTVHDTEGNAYPQTFNDIFRAVHDIFGHAKEGVETGARGEENAWRAHASMYSPEARKAMTTETRGQNSWVNFGPHLRDEKGNIAKKGEAGFVPPQERPFSDQKVMLLPDEFSSLDTVPRWSRNAEEQFASDAERYLSRKLQPEQNAPLWTALRDGLGAVWQQVRGSAVETNLVPREVRLVLDKHFGNAMEIAPPGRLQSIAKAGSSKPVLVGAAAGGALGATQGDDPGDIMRGIVMGAGAGLVARSALKRTYGYLPDALARLNTALRYTLSFTFDAGRYTEQNSIAMAKYGLPPMLSPTRYVKAREWKTPFRNGSVRGEDAWKDAVRLFDEINGGNTFQNIDDLDRRMYQAGVLGFSPRNWEVAQAFQLYQRGMSSEKIHEAISNIGRYGLGRSAAEKSANFVVFPFSFSKKYLGVLGDFMLQAPARNLILHETARRYYESEYDEKFNDFLSRRAPLLKELATVNNLYYGISPGRFFLQGLSDHRTNVGKAAQLLASFFVPSGAATPLAEGAGNLGDLAVHALAPVVLTGESINRAGGIDNITDVFARYVPFVREVNSYFTGPNAAIPRQARALMEGADPFYQFQQYQDGLRLAKAELEPYALAFGYSSVDGLLGSDVGMALQPGYESTKNTLAEEFPSGFRMSQSFDNEDAIDARAILDLAAKPDRSAAEDQILSLVDRVQTWQQMGETLGFDSSMLQSIIASQVRGAALPNANDPRFAELWDRFFLREYGPIRRIA